MTSTVPRPTVSAPAPWFFPDPRRRRLDNGLSVLVYDLPGRELAAVRLVFDAPLAAEGRDGTASLATDLWTEGTEELDVAAFARRIESIGASYWAAAGHDGPVAALTAPTARLGESLGLLAASVMRPAYAEREFARVVKEERDAIEVRRAQAEYRAYLELYGALFTADSRMSRPLSGTAQDLAALDVAAVRAYHERFVAPSAATLVLVGDFRGTDVDALVDVAFGPWTGTAAPAAGQEARAQGPRVLLVDRPGAVQSAIRAGLPSIDRRSPDWASLGIGTYALGGHIGSRLSKVLREEKGYTYGIFAGNSSLRHGSVASIACAVETDVTGPALADLAEVVRSTVAGGIDAAERDIAADCFLRVGPIAFQTSDAVAAQVADVVSENLEPGYFNQWQDAVRAVTPESASAALGTHLPFDGLSLVVVGDASKIEDAVRDAWPGEPFVVRA
ncbi:M16 family metallopeptidase [Streptomyces sp. NBC_01497]|uniref:M16 family metallopeptidase n=1 Tax=Streptomyces sp. NBC_01497 TaxID=2903885 RepID=UPI002E3077D1|nr:pitrilysin family protein [Streptomyces sp. NBC_01497]